MVVFRGLLYFYACNVFRIHIWVYCIILKRIKKTRYLWTPSFHCCFEDISRGWDLLRVYVCVRVQFFLYTYPFCSLYYKRVTFVRTIYLLNSWTYFKYVRNMYIYLNIWYDEQQAYFHSSSSYFSYNKIQVCINLLTAFHKSWECVEILMTEIDDVLSKWFQWFSCYPYTYTLQISTSRIYIFNMSFSLLSLKLETCCSCIWRIVTLSKW